MRIDQIVVLVLLFVIVFSAVLKGMSLMRPDPLKRRIGQIGVPLGDIDPQAAICRCDHMAWNDREPFDASDGSGCRLA